MERRNEPRRHRRLQVKFWRRGSSTPTSGYSTNISRTGIFVATRQPLPSGERLRLEIGSGDRSFVCEGVVARALRTPQLMQSVQSSGMGIRFLTIAELVAELLPQVAPPSNERPMSEDRYTTTESSSEAAEGGRYEVRFPDAKRFLDAYHRDMRTAGLFVPTATPAKVGDRIPVRVRVAEPGVEPIDLQARVVQAFEPSPDGEATNLIVGMGVEILDADVSFAALERLARQLES